MLTWSTDWNIFWIIKNYIFNLLKLIWKAKRESGYILLFNEDIPDGLANGAVGILRNYVFDRKCPEKIEILLFDFLEDEVGLDRRNNFININNINCPTTNNLKKKI